MQKGIRQLKLIICYFQLLVHKALPLTEIGYFINKYIDRKLQTATNLHNAIHDCSTHVHYQTERQPPGTEESKAYLYEDSFRIVVCHDQSLQHGETDCETALQSLHFYRQALLLLCSKKCSKLPGVVLQLSVSELIEGSHIRQLPFCFHQQRQMLRTHILL